MPIGIPSLGGNINFHAQHAPIGAFMSFTCGKHGAAGGIGLELGKPANQNIYVGVKNGSRRSAVPIRCLPFAKGAAPARAAANYNPEKAPPVITDPTQWYSADEIRRAYGWATDSWQTDDLTFSIHTPFGEIPEPGGKSEKLRESLLPAILATVRIDNRQGIELKTAFFAIDFTEPGTRLLSASEMTSSGSKKLGFGWRNSVGVLGKLESTPSRQTDDQSGEIFAFQRWSIQEGITNINPVHALASTAGLGFEVLAGAVRTLVLAIGVYLDGIVTTGLEGKYYYTRFYSSLDEVLTSALDASDDLRSRAADLDKELLTSGPSPAQQFMIAHSTRSYYGCTQLLDIGGEPFWIVNEGEYCMMNTLDLSIDQAFWELDHNPWVVRNLLNSFIRHYSYHDQVKTRGGRLLPGGIAFTHDMGVNNNFSRPGHSSYELANLNGCFSYMTQEELCNWILLAACYVANTGDLVWLREQAHVIGACADSMRARANDRTGVMTHDSARCESGQEITTYDSLDESLSQARSSTYIATKCWATWIAIDMLSAMQSSSAEGNETNAAGFADAIARTLLASVSADGALPAVLEKDNAGYQSRTLPVIESLIYPAYWLDCLRDQSEDNFPGIQAQLASRLEGTFIEMLKRHTIKLLSDPQSRNLFADGGIKLSSTSNNSWMSKIAIFQYVVREILRLHRGDPQLAALLERSDLAHMNWQTDGSAYWACSDQFISGIAKGSRYYPRIITAALWMKEKRTQCAPDAPITPALTPGSR